MAEGQWNNGYAPGTMLMAYNQGRAGFPVRDWLYADPHENGVVAPLEVPALAAPTAVQGGTSVSLVAPLVGLLLGVAVAVWGSGRSGKWGCR